MIDTHPRGPVPMETTMPDPTAIRLASEARRADLADELYSSVVEMHNLIDKAYQDERAALLVAIDLLAKAGADPGGATDACRFLGCSAADLLATVTSLYETRGGLVAEVADLRAKMSNLTGGADLTDDEIAAVWRRHTKLPAHCYFGKDDCAAAREFVNRGRAEERKAWQDATGCPTPDEARAKRERWTEVSRANLATIDDLRAQLDAAEAEADNLRRRVDIAEASRADQVRMHDRAQAALEEERARVAELEARPVLTVEALTALVEAMDDAVPAHAYLLIDAGTGTARLSFSMDGRFTKAEPLYRKHEVRRWVASIAADSTVTLPTPDRAGATNGVDPELLRGLAGKLRASSMHDDQPRETAAEVAQAIENILTAHAAKPPPTPSPRYVAVTASAVPPGTAPERVAWFDSYVNARDCAAQMNAGEPRNLVRWDRYEERGAWHVAAILDTHAEAPPVAPPRFVAVPRAEVNGRPASWFHTEAEAGRYVALCNDNPDLFGADDEIEGALESYTHAVVDTCATPPALPQVEAFELPAVEWTEEVGGGAERSVGARHRAVACGDGSWRLTIDGKTTSSAESKARVEAAGAVLAGRAEVRR